MAVIENVLRPPIRGESGGVHQNVRGLPTGSPAHNVMLNLHLTPLDDVLGAIGGGFYARFGDDFLFAHPEVEVARKASAQIDEVVASLALEIQPRKRRNLWLNGAGRASPAADFLSAQETQFLGAAVTFRGNLRLPPSKSHQLFAELERRLAQTARLAREGPPLSGDDELRLLCEVVAAGFDRHSVFALPHLGALLGEIDDRGHLHDLEQRLARLVLRVARGARSLRALRTIPPSRLREMGLPSLVLLRGRRR